MSVAAEISKLGAAAAVAVFAMWVIGELIADRLDALIDRIDALMEAVIECCADRVYRRDR